jgi:hypothetical protein
MNILWATNLSAQGWKGLRPIFSKRSDVENLLGKSSGKSKGYGRYETDKFKVSVWYSPGPCKVKEGLNWNVKSGFVTYIEVRRKGMTSIYNLELYDLERDILTFVKREHPTDKTRFGFSSPRDDIDIMTSLNDDGSQTIDYIGFRPGKEYSYLLCRPKIKQIRKPTNKLPR